MTTPPPSSGAHSAVTVPPETMEKFHDLVELILASESMNDEERQYWINILPIMTPEQIQNLNQILNQERQQLAVIDQKYGKEISAMQKSEIVRRTEQVRSERKRKLQSKELKSREQEDRAAQELLQNIEQQGEAQPR
ncbi:hypothetical protein FJZ27_01235 [Candidatus Peribacteria bacterium]|nr:hypothetical protein [Candidatus Peribacteria bacterium]